MAESIKSKFTVKGSVKLDAFEGAAEELPLTAFAFDSHGQLLGKGEVNHKGSFVFSVRLSRPSEIELTVGPISDEKSIRSSSAYSTRYQAAAWDKEKDHYTLKPELVVQPLVWKLWWPLRICVSGHVRKIHTEDGYTHSCPVPFVKVEIFDVDREFCFWPYIKRWWDILLDRPVIRIPELLKERPRIKVPFPIPDPIGPVSLDPELVRASGVDWRSINPQPEPPGGPAYLGPQPEPPDLQAINVNYATTSLQNSAGTRVGENRLLMPELASRFDKLTITGKIAPWLIFPRCFYSIKRVCETTTDETGYFRCCFQWWPLQFRFGRLRFDWRPDIIVKVTQLIDGVEKVLYMDPYTSTRWNVTNTHIDLWLDNEEIVCGGGAVQQRPEGTQVFFTRIGDDEVHDIDQTSGLYNGSIYTNVAYGHSLFVYAQFGDNLSDGSPLRYYRLSYARQGSPGGFVPITVPLSDFRVNKATSYKDTEYLGPMTVKNEPALYKIRNFAEYLWYNPDKIGIWNSWIAEPDSGKYILRLEVFDENGQFLDSTSVDYRDGTAPTNGTLPTMTDHCDLLISLDNNPPIPELTLPTSNPCGVIPWATVPPMNFLVNVSQDNNRLHYWYLQYTKGTNPTKHTLAYEYSNSGAITVPVSETIDGTASPTGLNMLAGVNSTCAFALILKALPHIRNGRHFVYYREQVKAIAVEKCDCEE